MGGALEGYTYAALAALMFGMQYVPVKKYEIYDGTTFQWFMCSGILMTGCVLSMASGSIEVPISPLCMLGGALWALSNYIVLPLVKLLGIGLGFSLYHFVNLVVGYAVGRLGLFGLPVMASSYPNGLLICDGGAALLLVSFVIMIFVEGGPDTAAEPALGKRHPKLRLDSGLDEEFRQQYRKWRVGEAAGARDSLTNFLVSAAGAREHGSVRYFNFGLFSDPSDDDLDEETTVQPEVFDRDCALKRAASSPNQLTKKLLDGKPADKGLGKMGTKVLGVILAILGGTLCGVNNVPPSLYAVEHPGLPPTGAVFSQCLGIWMTSTIIYLVYSSAARLSGWRVPHSVIRPAFASGCIWSIGFYCMLFGIRDLGYSIGYTLDAVGPVAVSSIVSIVFYKEISGGKQLALFFLSFTLQLIGVTLIAVFGA
eukprot:TRINITY_DN74184_c0_g1_i1.p1 TRINITY_DN74184_c0_g1~~TRINITY_DN74184_c0_g1_i1.p1  ORF type:complete len:425 (+),score=34.56 TRINITY_DN74184_c0_g1_i1:78-1352(+)